MFNTWYSIHKSVLEQNNAKPCTLTIWRSEETIMPCFSCFLQDLNVDEFEEIFKTRAQGPAIDVTSSKQKTIQKVLNKVSLLDSNRAKNLAITLRKVGKTPEEICKAIQM